jgi:hypothetical protein
MRLLTTFLVTTLFAISTTAAAQETAKTQEISSPNDEHVGLFYPVIDASYVGGTVPDMPLKESNSFMRWISFSKRQFRVRGRLVLGPDGFFFAFNPQGASPVASSSAQFQLLSCSAPALPAEAVKACHKDPARKVLKVPYQQLIELSRARASSGDLLTATTVYASTAVGVLSTVVGAFSRTHAKELYGGITAGTLALGYYFLVSRPRSGDNYIALFVCAHDEEPCSLNEASRSNPASVESEPSKTTVKNGADELFKKGDVLMFKIPNSHDYYNISMILSARTGKTFVSETSEKGGK